MSWSARDKTGKGQISVDYLVAIIILGIISLAILQAFGTGDVQARSAIEKAYMRSVADTLASGIDSVAIMGDGAQKVITLPNTTISGRPYNVTIKGNMLLLRWPGSDCAERFATSDLELVMPDQTAANATLLPGNLLITNSNGTIRLQNVRKNAL
jgi:hypothetical protein